MLPRDNGRPLLTIKEAASILHVHTSTLRRWHSRGLLRAYRINARGDRRFPREDVLRLAGQLAVSNKQFSKKTLPCSTPGA
jgi:excisionase family DNA binding protein